MTDPQEVFPGQFLEAANRALDDLLRPGTGLAAGLIVTSTGVEVAFRALGQNVESSKLAAMARSANALGSSVTHGVGYGEKFRSVIVDSEKGRIFLIEVPGTEGSLVLVAISTPGTPFGQSLLACQGCCSELGAAIKTIPGFSLHVQEASVATVLDVCRQVMQNLDEAVGMAVLDLESGLPFALMHNVPITQECLGAVATAAVEMFRGKNILTVERHWSMQRGKEVKHSIREIQMTTDRTVHFMAVVPDRPKVLMVLITTKKANLTHAWSVVHNTLDMIAPLCPQ